MTLLTVNDVHAGYGTAPVLYGVSVEVEAGEIVAVLGPNGAGKTTLLRCISGLLPISSGQITLGDVDLGTRTAEQIVAAGLAHSPEGRGVFPALTVAENLRLGGYVNRSDSAKYAEVLERVYGFFPRLHERTDQQAGTLSGGEQQMLAIGRALMSTPSVLLIDEASLGLAPIIVERLFEIVEEINATGTTILMVEQNASFTLAIAHRAFVMQKGTIVFAGTAQELRDAGVAETYLGTPKSKAGTNGHARASGGVVRTRKRAADGQE